MSSPDGPQARTQYGSGPGKIMNMTLARQLSRQHVSVPGSVLRASGAFLGRIVGPDTAHRGCVVVALDPGPQQDRLPKALQHKRFFFPAELAQTWVVAQEDWLAAAGAVLSEAASIAAEPAGAEEDEEGPAASEGQTAVKPLSPAVEKGAATASAVSQGRQQLGDSAAAGSGGKALGGGDGLRAPLPSGSSPAQPAGRKKRASPPSPTAGSMKRRAEVPKASAAKAADSKQDDVSDLIGSSVDVPAWYVRCDLESLP